jgi:broad specificity phosphatase PhoE
MTSTESAAQETETNSTVIPGPELPPIAPTTKRLFLVRHGEVINPGGVLPVYYGAMDVPLSPLGEKEARAAAQYLQQFDLQHVASSPLSRAVYGANQVLELQGSNSDLVVLEGFVELDRGAWCGLTKEEIGAENMARFDSCDESVTPDGGESYPALKKRVLEARDALLEMKEKGRASAVVTHLQVTRSILSDALGVPTNSMALLRVATASITCIDYCTVTGTQSVHFQSFKPNVGLQRANDGAN